MKRTDHHFPRIGAGRLFSLLNAALSLAGVILSSSCALTPPTVVRETVGPGTLAASDREGGFLTVYSASLWTTADDLSSSLRSYTDYEIRTLDGATVQHVVNGDEEPARVELPAGRYLVVAPSDTAGTVDVPVAIEPRRTTIVHLDREQDASALFAGSPAAALVRLPSGQPIGFRAHSVAVPAAPLMMTAQSKMPSSVREQPRG